MLFFTFFPGLVIVILQNKMRSNIFTNPLLSLILDISWVVTNLLIVAPQSFISTILTIFSNTIFFYP